MKPVIICFLCQTASETKPARYMNNVLTDMLISFIEYGLSA